MWKYLTFRLCQLKWTIFILGTRDFSSIWRCWLTNILQFLMITNNYTENIQIPRRWKSVYKQIKHNFNNSIQSNFFKISKSVFTSNLLRHTLKELDNLFVSRQLSSFWKFRLPIKNSHLSLQNNFRLHQILKYLNTFIIVPKKMESI